MLENIEPDQPHNVLHPKSSCNRSQASKSFCQGGGGGISSGGLPLLSTHNQCPHSDICWTGTARALLSVILPAVGLHYGTPGNQRADSDL